VGLSLAFASIFVGHAFRRDIKTVPCASYRLRRFTRAILAGTVCQFEIANFQSEISVRFSSGVGFSLRLRLNAQPSTILGTHHDLVLSWLRMLLIGR